MSGDMLDRVPGFFTLCTGVIIVYAVIYDWTYFQVVGTAFYKTYTLSDHITSALERLPLAGFGFFLGILISLFRSKRQTDKAAPLPANALILYEGDFGKLYITPDPLLSGVLALVFIILPIILFAPGYIPSGFLYLSALFLWESLARVPVNYLATVGLPNLRPVLFYVPVLFMYSFLTGLSGDFADISDKPGHYKFKFSNGVVVENARVLRSTESNLLLRIPQQQTNQMIPWNQIMSIEISAARPEKSLACNLIGLCLFD